MPIFSDSVTAPAPPEEVWKILHDPYRLPAWWAGLADVDVAPAGAGRPEVSIYYADEPEVARPLRREAHPSGLRIVISCLSTGIGFTWQLEPVDGGRASLITALVDIPENEKHRLESQRTEVATSLRQLAELAADAQP